VCKLLVHHAISQMRPGRDTRSVSSIATACRSLSVCPISTLTHLHQPVVAPPQSAVEVRRLVHGIIAWSVAERTPRERKHGEAERVRAFDELSLVPVPLSTRLGAGTSTES